MSRITLDAITPWDKQLDELAINKADCMIKLYMQQCNLFKCTSCSKQMQMSNCYQQLTDIEKLRVDRESIARYMNMVYAYKKNKKKENVTRTYMLFVMVVLIGIMILIGKSVFAAEIKINFRHMIPTGFMCEDVDYSYTDYDVTTDMIPPDLPFIVDTSIWDRVHICEDAREIMNITDWDKDGKLTSFDYCVSYKIAFDIICDIHGYDLHDTCQVVMIRDRDSDGELLPDIAYTIALGFMYNDGRTAWLTYVPSENPGYRSAFDVYGMHSLCCGLTDNGIKPLVVLVTDYFGLGSNRGR